MPAHSPKLLLDLVNRRLAAGRTAPAILWGRMAVHAAPASADALALLGAAYKRQHRWHPAQTACREAVRLDPTHHQAWTDLGFAATACNNAELALQAWNVLGVADIHIEDRKPPKAEQERVQVHFLTEFGPELVDAERMGPATALLVGIPTPATGRRCGDFVLLNDLVGQTYTMYGRVYRAFQMQAVLTPSERSTWHAVVKVDWTDKLTDLNGHSQWFRAVAHTWESSHLPPVKQLWGANLPSEPSRTVHLGVSATRYEHALAFVQRWTAARADRVLHSLHLGLP